jgi:hypothetical protein
MSAWEGHNAPILLYKITLQIGRATTAWDMMLSIIIATAVAIGAFVLGWQMGFKKTHVHKVDRGDGTNGPRTPDALG